MAHVPQTASHVLPSKRKQQGRWFGRLFLPALLMLGKRFRQIAGRRRSCINVWIINSRKFSLKCQFHEFLPRSACCYVHSPTGGFLLRFAGSRILLSLYAAVTYPDKSFVQHPVAQMTMVSSQRLASRPSRNRRFGLRRWRCGASCGAFGGGLSRLNRDSCGDLLAFVLQA